MFASFRKFLSEVAGGGKDPNRFEQSDYRLAAAALLVHAAAIDGEISSIEAGAAWGRAAAVRARSSGELGADCRGDRRRAPAIDLYQIFTRMINRSLDENGRRRMVEMMWEMVHADNHITEFESNLIWRAADLLGVSSREQDRARPPHRR